MFWRFGFHNPSAVDTLLDREDVTLEEVLEEEELLQEAKSHNQRLVDLYPFYTLSTPSSMPVSFRLVVRPLDNETETRYCHS